MKRKEERKYTKSENLDDKFHTVRKRGGIINTYFLIVASHAKVEKNHHNHNNIQVSVETT